MHYYLLKRTTPFLLILLVRVAVAQPLRIAVVLPFCAEMSNADLTKKRLASVQKSALEYYQGILLAIDSLEKMGLKATVKVYDTNKDSLTTLRILNLPEIKDMDLVIGPLFREGIDMAAKICLEKRVYHLSPAISMNTPINSPFLIKPNPEPEAYAATLAAWLRETHADTARITLVTDGKKFSKTFSPHFKKLTDSLLGVGIVKMEALTKDLNLEDLAQSEKGNIIVLPVNEDAVVNRLLKTLKEPLFPVTLVGMESWLDFKTNDFERWEKYGLHLVCGYYVQHSQQPGFRYQYRIRFKAEPTELAYKGFDQLFYIGKLMIDNGKGWPDYLETGAETMHNTFRFEQDARTGNWVNRSVRVLKFENFQLQRLR